MGLRSPLIATPPATTLCAVLNVSACLIEMGLLLFSLSRGERVGVRGYNVY
jgi:hypothetical protein